MRIGFPTGAWPLTTIVSSTVWFPTRARIKYSCAQIETIANSFHILTWSQTWKIHNLFIGTEKWPIHSIFYLRKNIKKQEQDAQKIQSL